MDAGWTSLRFALEPLSEVEIHLEMDMDGMAMLPPERMDQNGAQFVKWLCIGLNLGEGYQLKTIQ